ncbi:hypothetical protein [Ruegeria atlantica]|uniref:Uncharacterized protein n=1 Tax=Ruegeria atlantica TaxID=81569 RepID=A0A0P1E8N7_9RHOB|nr:hypothetical protein [Ruegeria atlantica]CUH45422.1 hypothetical protein RUM4293_04336 [Ruegeria atlantica]
MGQKAFTQINSSILNSKKLKQCSHEEKWAYLCAHLSPLGSYTGQFEYPLVMWQRDAQVTDIEPIIEQLEQVGLVQFDSEEEFVRITGFLRQRPPENASRAFSLAMDLSYTSPLEGMRADMLLGGVAELAVGAIQRAQNWKQDSSDWPKLRGTVQSLLNTTWQQYGDALCEHLTCELDTASVATKAEIGSLFAPFLAFGRDTVSTPSAHPIDTRDVDETILKRDENETKTKTNTGLISDFAQSRASNQDQRSEWQRKEKTVSTAALDSALSKSARASN